GKSEDERTASIVDCFSFSGDDNLTLGEQVTAFSLTVSGCFLATMANSNVHLNYWSQPDLGSTATFTDLDMLHLGIEDTGPGGSTFPVYGGNCHIKCWSDGYIGQEQDGRFGVTFSSIRLWGPHDSRWLMLANEDYPFDDYDDAVSRDQRGQIARFVFDGVTIEEEPGQLAVITGLDWLNTPHSVAFRGVTIGGEPLLASNFADYFTWNAFPYFLTVEGQTVVTAVEICNRALGLIGESPFVTSIAPPDDTRAAKLCAKYFAAAFEEVTQGHEWAWATKRAALVEVASAGNDTWQYCYQIPAGMLQAIEVVPKGAPDGYRDAKGERIKFRVELGTQTVKRVWTNLADAWLRYTVYVTDVNQLDPFAQEALVMNLAGKLAAALMQGKEGQSAMQQYLQMAQYHIGRARANDGNQRILTPESKVSWLGEGRE
ncbi:MAG TPA: hypothetical protein PKB00_05570, partial [Microthrixaceae bacterium]|nr:hypothetical protein [Microthrixaceae bacterium]